MKKIRVLICVYNISGYLMAGVRKLLEHADVLLVQSPAYEVLTGDEQLRNRCEWIDCDPSCKSREILQKVCAWKPDVLLCAGWNYPLFMQIAKKLHAQGCSTVVWVDTIWRNDFKQKFHALLAPFYLVPRFDYGWGAGEGQVKNLRHIGFKENQVFKGCYAADSDRFSRICMIDQKPWPHRFLYIGRYIEAKNLSRMFRAFIHATETVKESDWELVCVGSGKGKVWKERAIHPRIHHLGYCPPAKMADTLPPVGCFVLPSVFEPWGLVVQECAIMGLPLFCSSAVHATEAYLVDGKNGFIFEPYDEEAMAHVFEKIMRMPDDALREMGMKSRELGLSYTSEDWANRVMAFSKAPRATDRLESLK